MAANKVTLNTPDGEEVLIDLTKDTIEPSMVVSGITFHDASGAQKVGTVREVTAPGGFGFSDSGVRTEIASGEYGVSATTVTWFDVLLRKNTTFTMIVPWSVFGDTPPSGVLEGNVFTSSSGLKQTGTFTLTPEITAQDDLLAKLAKAVRYKAAGNIDLDPEMAAQDALISNILTTLARKLPSKT